MDSYMRMEPATDALSELMRPTIGMLTMKSHASLVNRLNASVAGSILMYESMRQRLQKKG